MDVRKIKKLIELIESSDIAELEIVEGEESVRISRNYNVLHLPMLLHQFLLHQHQLPHLLSTKHLLLLKNQIFRAVKP